MADLAFLVFVALIVVAWHDGRQVQEIAVARCRRACEQAGLQFLDDIAPVWRLRLARDAHGVLRLRRVFTFDYCTALGERRRGSIVMLGRTPVALDLAGQAHDSRTDRFYP